MIDLCTKAGAEQSSSWKLIGTIVESDTTDISTLRVSAGPGIQLVIESQKIVSIAAVVPAADIQRFHEALRKAVGELAD
ncbi:MAG TPA: hypothetical protein VKU80_12125 [Planctomycetota bacterium]|nr:hypothetical protein [Planctomycetota bacterium]